MASKKPKVLWRTEVNNKREWEQMLQEKQGLVVVEVYCSQYGPCQPIAEILKKLKLIDTETDYLHIALAKADEIDELERFRSKSEPVFMLVGNGKLVTILFGVNPPLILSKIKMELENEMKVMRGEMKRVVQSFTAITKEEKIKIQKDEQVQKEMQVKEALELVERLGRYRLPALIRLQLLLQYRGLVMFFPSAKLASGETPVMTRMTECFEDLDLTVESLEDVMMTQEKIHNIFSDSGFEIPKPVKELMLKETCVVAVLEDKNKRLDLGEIETLLATEVYGKWSNGKIDCNKPVPKSIAATYSIKAGRGTSRSQPSSLPVVWTPLNELQKSAAMDALFPYKLKNEFQYVSPSLPPQQVIIGFEAQHGKNVETVIDENAPVIYRYGYFTSFKAKEAQLVCKSWKTLLQLGPSKVQSSKLVIGIKDWSENMLLEFFIVDPTYLIIDPNTGCKQAELFFPYNYDEMIGEQPRTRK